MSPWDFSVALASTIQPKIMRSESDPTNQVFGGCAARLAIGAGISRKPNIISENHLKFKKQRTTYRYVILVNKCLPLFLFCLNV